MAPKRLSIDDMLEANDYKKERATYTDRDAQKLGYPSAAVLYMADRLSALAAGWRKTKSNLYVAKYQAVLSKMIDNGYDIDQLPIQDQLPKRFMIKSSARKSGAHRHWREFRDKWMLRHKDKDKA